MRASISRNDILRVYPRATRSPDVVAAAVLDVAFDLVLHQLHRHELFRECGLVFKGGTALRKFDIGHKGRFSFDLDFHTTEDPGVVAEMVGEALKDSPQSGIELEMTERRGHHSITVASKLLPDQQRRAKIDFSQRGLYLPPRNLGLLASPLRSSLTFDTTFAVPVIDLDENIAEKLSRWRSNPLIRDLYDISALANRVADPARVAAIYVLKSYLGWVASAPNRRPATPAVALTDTLEGLAAASFDLDDLVLPNAPSDTDKHDLTNKWLKRLTGLFDALDVHVRGERLQRFATNTDSSLTYEAATELGKIGKEAAAGTQPITFGGLVLADQQTSGLASMVGPEVQELDSVSTGATCGAPTTGNGTCGHPAPPVGGKCAAGHERR